ncbi:hypothetical protein ACIOC2_22710 [Streptomyces sp. NPDC088337]|uniref:hypothetical protein n=1 Tax=unclassified Streptomyces TaxID=2593676 RepID=UPI003818425D
MSRGGTPAAVGAGRVLRLADYLVEVGLCEPGETAEFDARFFRRQLEDKLHDTAAAADAGYPDNEGLVIDPETGIPSLKPHRAVGLTPSPSSPRRTTRNSTSTSPAV